jgi:hypothetical protein
MKLFYLFPFLFVFTGTLSLFAQQKNQISAASEKVFISIAKDSKQPPYLEIINYKFIDTNENNKIDAGETVRISFDLTNTGKGPGVGLTLGMENNSEITGIKFFPDNQILEIKPDETIHIEIPIEGSIDLVDGLASFRVMVNEPNGFGTDPLDVEIETQAFRSPFIKMVDYQVSSQAGSKIEKRRPFDVEVLIQNIGQGVAEDVFVTAILPANLFCLTANQLETLGKLQPGEQKLISYNFVANNEFQGDNIECIFRIREKHSQYAEDGKVLLTMNQQVSTEKLVVRGIEEKEVKIAIASLTSDVDKNIPVISEKYPNKVALIFGNEDYSRILNAEINVDYARRDAGVFWEYAVKVFGVMEENVYFFTDATAGKMKTEIDRVCELIKRMGPETEFIFYYAGHGYPDDQSHAPYLIPVDVNATNLSSAIPLKEVYKKFGATGAKKITVVLDACFSGGGRNQGLLAARGVRIKPKEEELMGNMVVFSASTGEQTALPFHEEKHGMFTYFLLKQIKETQGTVTFGKLDEYLRSQVGINSLRIMGKTQDPVTTVSTQLNQIWKELTF